MQWAKQKGFTIVELLIVVVVIAILATITIVAYNGIQDRARDSAAKSAIASAAKGLEAAKIQSPDQRYPSSLPTGMPSVNSIYEYNSGTNDYCFSYANGSTQYFITSRHRTPTPGFCNGLIGWWPFNGSVEDKMRGAVSSAEASVSGVGQNGQADSGWFMANDSGSRYVQTDLLFSPQNFTASVWFNPNGGGGSSGFSSIMSNSRDCCAQYIGFQIDYNKSTYNLVGRLWANGNGAASSLAATNAITLGSWHHVAVTYDGSSFILYLNGQQVGANSYSNSLMGTSLVPMKIGGMGHTPTGYTLGGSIDDARVYNRALSAAELSGMYALGAQ